MQTCDFITNWSDQSMAAVHLQLTAISLYIKVKPVHYSSTEKRFFTCAFQAEIMGLESNANMWLPSLAVHLQLTVISLYKVKPVHNSSTEKRFFTCVFQAEIMGLEYLFIKQKRLEILFWFQNTPRFWKSVNPRRF